MPDRTWLRGFLDLGALREQEGISEEAIRLQEDTVLAALDTLESEPGVLLADEVGMGKTYQALGVIASRLHLAGAGSTRVLVVTPGPDLNHQWLRAAKTFGEKGFYRDFPEDCFAEARHITALPEAVAGHPVVFAPVSVFTSARGHAERGFLLDLWFARRGLHGHTRNAILRRVAEAGVPTAPGDSFLGLGPERFEGLPDVAFRKGEEGGHDGLDDLHDRGLDAFRSGWGVKKALDRVRFQAVRSVLPEFDLLVVDEAHKLKNPWTVQAQAVSQVLGGRFRRAVFLTATPFQLGVHELRRVFDLFGEASEVRPGFEDDVDALFDAIGDYQRTYDAFEAAWRFADAAHAAAFARWYEGARRVEVPTDPRAAVPGLEALDDPNVATLARYAWELKRLKGRAVEPGFRRWTLRSLKPGKRQRRCENASAIPASERSVAPLLLYQRLMTARARAGTRSHVEAAETNIASSFAAAREGAMLAGDGASPEVATYQRVVRDLLDAANEAHPKVEHVLEEVMAAAGRWEKSLVFCERNLTIDTLHHAIEQRWMDRLVARWRKLYRGRNLDRDEVFGAGSGDDRTVGVFQRWTTRFTKGQDQLSIALRESYPHTLFVAPHEPGLPGALWADLGVLLADANEVLAAQRSSGTNAERLDYRLARRCVDVAVARWFDRHRPAVLDGYGGLPRILLDPAYPRLGLDRVIDDEERELEGSADRPVEWQLTEDTLAAILHPDRPSIWFPFREAMAGWEPGERGAIEEAVRTFLTRRQVPFLLDALEAAGGSEASSHDVRDAIERIWRDPEGVWRRRVAVFLEYLPKLGQDERREVLDEALARGELAARGNTLVDRRRAVQDAFNTPFFPMVLIGNKTLQEGLNLHRQCRRVVHHDLRWNPADVEQRVGRVDRHGSLAERVLAQTAGRDGHIQIETPLLERTIDPGRYRRVKEREKWLEFLLGVPPEIGGGDLDRSEVQPLPPALTEDLRIRLEPPAAPWGAALDGRTAG